MSTRELFRGEMLAWLNARLAPPGVVITGETQLFATGIINSIKVLELIAFTERAIGSEVPDRMIKLDNFWSVDRIATVFIQVPDDAAA